MTLFDTYFKKIMSYPKKAKGWRHLILNGQQFQWKLLPKAEHSLLKLQGSNSSGQQAVVTLREWKDRWLSFGDQDVLPNEPKSLTTKLASQAVEFALQNGWKPEEAGTSINFEYKDSSFALLK